MLLLPFLYFGQNRSQDSSDSSSEKETQPAVWKQTQPGVVESPCKSVIQSGHSLGHQYSQSSMDIQLIIPQEYKTSSKLEKWLKFIFALLPFPMSVICPFVLQQGD